MVTAKKAKRSRPMADAAGQSLARAGAKTDDMTPRAAAAVRTARQIRPIRIRMISSMVPRLMPCSWDDPDFSVDECQRRICSLAI